VRFKMAKRETILVLAAHADDPAIGAGGTLAKYAKAGKRIRTVVFSFGELSHPHLKRRIIAERRRKEALNADKLLGGSGIIFLGLKEMKFKEDFKKKNIPKKIEEIIKKEKPVKIFTHGIGDIHPHHKAVYNLIKQLADKGQVKCGVYSFDIWSLFKLRKRNFPRLIVDVTETFPTKIKAFLAHKSQKVTIINVLWGVCLKDLISGWINGYRFAEVFYKLR